MLQSHGDVKSRKVINPRCMCRRIKVVILCVYMCPKKFWTGNLVTNIVNLALYGFTASIFLLKNLWLYICHFHNIILILFVFKKGKCG